MVSLPRRRTEAELEAAAIERIERAMRRVDAAKWRHQLHEDIDSGR